MFGKLWVGTPTFEILSTLRGENKFIINIKCVEIWASHEDYSHLYSLAMLKNAMSTPCAMNGVDNYAILISSLGGAYYSLRVYYTYK